MNKFYEWLAYKLPNRLVYFCFFKVVGFYAVYEEDIPKHLRVTTALRKWKKYCEK